MREEKIKPGFKHVVTHIIFDIKMDREFTRKDRPVAGVYNTAPPLSITYSNFISREIFRLSFLIAGLKDLDICACAIVNAYLNDPYPEKP